MNGSGITIEDIRKIVPFSQGSNRDFFDRIVESSRNPSILIKPRLAVKPAL